ncbi:hypothetical protein DFR27_0731 [Umboniibacter marinipuniceus]|uniref:Uncharacterized protein n=1 Tax=Umboniibacter marinipuniceus TaxID=569599 RepID=A0A3M0APJ5_9GAMM|nr:hypothetical protein DFR27_0731 [Umboniibacter marinipuniceus]
MTAEINGFSIPVSFLTTYVFVSMIISVIIVLVLTRSLTKSVRVVCCFIAVILCFSLYGQWVYLAFMSLFSFFLSEHNNRRQSAPYRSSES